MMTRTQHVRHKTVKTNLTHLSELSYTSMSKENGQKLYSISIISNNKLFKSHRYTFVLVMRGVYIFWGFKYNIYLFMKQ